MFCENSRTIPADCRTTLPDSRTTLPERASNPPDSCDDSAGLPEHSAGIARSLWWIARRFPGVSGRLWQSRRTILPDCATSRRDRAGSGRTSAAILPDGLPRRTLASWLTSCTTRSVKPVGSARSIAGRNLSGAARYEGRRLKSQLLYVSRPNRQLFLATAPSAMSAGEGGYDFASIDFSCRGTTRQAQKTMANASQTQAMVNACALVR